MRRRRIGFWYRLAVVVVEPVLLATTRRVWRGAEHIPATGPVIVCVNHISYADPFCFGYFVYATGRTPRFLAKASLFDIPFVGRLLRGAGQIPVYRESSDASRAFRAAVAAVRAGECVGVYPEGTITRDPGLWPMVGKTGAARIALATGAPVVPVAQWGAQDLLAPYAKRLRLFPRKTVVMSAGPPVDLSDLAALGAERQDAEVMRQATARIVAAITGLLAEIRQEDPPEHPFDAKESGLPVTGNPSRPRPPSGEATGRRR